MAIWFSPCPDTAIQLGQVVGYLGILHAGGAASYMGSACLFHMIQGASYRLHYPLSMAFGVVEWGMHSRLHMVVCHPDRSHKW